MTCAPTLDGTYCRLCDASAGNSSGVLYRYVPASSTTQAHCEPCGDTTLGTMLAVVAIIIGGVLLLVVMIARPWRKASPKRKAQASHLLKMYTVTYTVNNKLKVRAPNSNRPLPGTLRSDVHRRSISRCRRLSSVSI